MKTLNLSKQNQLLQDQLKENLVQQISDDHTFIFSTEYSGEDLEEVDHIQITLKLAKYDAIVIE